VKGCFVYVPLFRYVKGEAFFKVNYKVKQSHNTPRRRKGGDEV
jgi:hypothetical protein